MRSSNPGSRWSRIVVSLCSVAVLSGPLLARAEVGNEPSVTVKHADAMNRGLNHEEARLATERTTASASLATKHAAAMDRGLNHEDARVASHESGGTGKSPAKEHAAAMSRGLNHEEARVASDAM
jgi:hypothetical protein